MRQLVSTMKADTLLEYVVFRLTPTRTRCELFVSSGAVEEKLMDTSLLEPYCLHLQAALEQFKEGCYSIRLDPPAGDGGSRQKSWFTKGTIERFVRFVSTPEVLERVSTIDCELTKLEEALSSQFHEIPQFDNKTLLLEAPPALTGENILSGIQGDKATHYSKLGCTSLDVNGFSTVESARWGLLKAMEARKHMLQKEQGMAFARATAAGFTMDNISDIMTFSECFGAHRLREACIKYLALYKKKQEAGVWLDEMELPSSDTGSTHPDNGHRAYGNVKAPETWSDIHCEVGGLTLDSDARGNTGLMSSRSFYDGVPPIDQDTSSHANKFQGPAFGIGNVGLSGYAHDSLPGISGNMSLMAYSSPSFERHAQNSLPLNSHYSDPAGSMHMGMGHERLPINHGHPVPGMVPHPESAVYMRGPHLLPTVEGVAPAPHMQFLMQAPPYPANNLEAYHDPQKRYAPKHSGLASEFSGGYGSENDHRYSDGDFLKSGYQSHDTARYMRHNQSAHQTTREENPESQANMQPYYHPRNGQLQSGSPGSKRDEPSSDESLSRTVASDADTPVSSKEVPLPQYGSQNNIESEGSTSPKRRPSSKRLQLGRASGKHSGIVVIKNINYITSTNQNDSTPSSSANQNADESDEGEESPENAIQDPGLYLSNQDAFSDGNGKPPSLANTKPKSEASQSRSPWKYSEDLENVGDQPAVDLQKKYDFTISMDENSMESGNTFESESFHENHSKEKSKIVIPEDPQFPNGIDCKLQNISSSFGPDIMLFPSREIKPGFQTSKDCTRIESDHDQIGYEIQRADQTSDLLIFPKRCGRVNAVSSGNHFAESMEEKNQTQEHELHINDSFFVPSRLEPIKQTNTSWKSTFNMEAELPNDDHKNTAKDEKKDADFSMGFDDLICLPERKLTHKTANGSSEKPSNSDVNLLGSTCSSSNLNDVNPEESTAEVDGRKSMDLDCKKVIKTSDLTRENGKLINKKHPIAVRAAKSSSKSADTPSRNVATWGSKTTNPLKSKREKEEEERKRLEGLKLQRQERISARANSSGVTKAVTLTSRVSKSLSPGSKPLTAPRTLSLPGNSRLGPLAKATGSDPTNSNQKGHQEQSILGRKHLNRSLSSPLEFKKQNGKIMGT